VSTLADKARKTLRLGPRATAQLLLARARAPRERARVALGRARWPSAAALQRALAPGVTLAGTLAGGGDGRFFFEASRDAARLRTAIGTADRAALTARADLVCDHVFDLLGSGPVPLGPDIDWLRDFKSGFVWEPRYMADLCVVDLTNDADVKVPWELSRHQHFVTLGQAYVLTGDEKYAREFVAQLDSWMAADPPLLGVNWACTMDVALRAISWTWAWHLFEGAAAFDTAVRQRMLAGILAHGRFILGHVEDGDVRGNHYLSDGAGLAVIGLAFPALSEAAAWRAAGLDIVWGELSRQVLDDGVDFEMSTSYQRLVAELVITPTLLAGLNGIEPPAGSWNRIGAMLEFVAAATRPDGEIALFGDADDGRVQILSEETRVRVNDHRYLLALGAAVLGRPGLKAASGGYHAELEWLLGADGRKRFDALETAPDTEPKAYHDGGFYLMRGGGLWLMADCGPVGSAGTGGHGHNDALSFELCVGDVPVVVDSGTYTYTADIAAREGLRGTRAHNVVVVDGVEIAALGPGLWTIADQAQAGVTRWDVSGAAQVLEGVHHGYERLPEPVTVHRRFALDTAAGDVHIADRLEGTGVHQIELRFHTALDVTVDGAVAVLSRGGVPLARFEMEGQGVPDPFVEGAWLSPSYGVRSPGRCFGWRWTDAQVPWDASVRVCTAPVDGVGP
jgi:uncharacterized heparinase superfamily protein